MAHFQKHGLPPDWPTSRVDFQRHWPTDGDNTYVDFVRDGLRGDGPARSGSARWRRVTETRAGATKSVFHFDVPGSVAKSTHAGLPWLRFLRQGLGARIHFWPFDGWDPPPGSATATSTAACPPSSPLTLAPAIGPSKTSRAGSWG